MKRFGFIAVLVFVFGLMAKAQNVQLHYDMGDDRKMVTSTVEMFKADDWGSTFFFIDMDYGSDASGVDGMNLAYWEIARSFKVSKNCAFEPRVEYNGGFGRGEFVDGNNETQQYHYSINSSFLAGGQYTWNNADFSKVFTLQANYKYIKDKEDASFQITAVWGLHFFDRKLSLTGFADIWKEENVFVKQTNGDLTETDFVFIAEPQIWYNATKNLSVGGEVEMSSNFGGNEGFMVNPTLAAKWTF
ncbi:DUF5020 family protein [Marinilabiliaceae bacterium JC017]|nr:DUF5020 family protein [Marinilabiliaceae bacterium JC017]